MIGIASPRPQLWIYLSIATFAVVAWGTILLTPNALFWDDWVLAGDDTLRMTSELGLPWLGIIDIGLFAPGAWTFKVIVIVSVIVIGCASYSIAGRGLGLNRFERWLIASLIVVLPLMAPRAIVSLSHYSWSLALFMIAWYLLVRYPLPQSRRAPVVAASVLLFASYTTGSLLPFTILPVAHLVLLTYSRETPVLRQALRFLAQYWYVLAAPVVFWIMRTLFLQPYGLYDGYNAVGSLLQSPFYIRVGLLFLSMAFIGVLAVFLYSALAQRPRSPRLRHGIVVVLLGAACGFLGLYLAITRVSPSTRTLVVPVALILAALVVCVVGLIDTSRSRGSLPLTRAVVPLLAVGLLVLIVGMLPYLLVGKLPSFAEWETRHQLLMPFGTSIILVAAVRAIGAVGLHRLARVAGAGLVIVMLVTSIATSLTLVADWHKQMQIASALEDSLTVKDASTVVFIDSASSLNYDSRSFSFYEFNGWMTMAFGDQSRLGIELTNVEDVLAGSLDGLDYAASRYGFGEWTPSATNALVEITPRAGATWWDVLLDRPAIDLTITPVGELSTLVP